MKVYKYSRPKAGTSTTTSTSSGSGGGYTSVAKLEEHEIFGQPFDGTKDVSGNITAANGSFTGKVEVKNATTGEGDEMEVITFGDIEAENDIKAGGNIEAKGEAVIEGKVESNNSFKVGSSSVTSDTVSTKKVTASTSVTTEALVATTANIKGNLTATSAEIANLVATAIEATDITTENLTVTKEAHFFELIIDQISAAGGAVIHSPAGGFTVEKVEGNTLYWSKSDGAYNKWKAGDFARCQQFGNISSGSTVNTKYYWAKVKEVGEAGDYFYITLDSSSGSYEGTLNPEVGDDVVHLGSTDSSRGNAIYIASYSSIDSSLTAPLICQYKGITSYDLKAYKHTYMAANGNMIKGQLTVEAGSDLTEGLGTILDDIKTAQNTANSAVSTANSALSSADQAINDAKTAATEASNALAAAKTAQSTANTANSTANTANNTATTNKEGIAKLEVKVDGITTEVASVETRLGEVETNVTEVEQTANSVTTTVANMTTTDLLAGDSKPYFTADKTVINFTDAPTDTCTEYIKILDTYRLYCAPPEDFDYNIQTASITSKTTVNVTPGETYRLTLTPTFVVPSSGTADYFNSDNRRLYVTIIYRVRTQSSFVNTTEIIELTSKNDTLTSLDGEVMVKEFTAPKDAISIEKIKISMENDTDIETCDVRLADISLTIKTLAYSQISQTATKIESVVEEYVGSSLIGLPWLQHWTLTDPGYSGTTYEGTVIQYNTDTNTTTITSSKATNDTMSSYQYGPNNPANRIKLKKGRYVISFIPIFVTGDKNWEFNYNLTPSPIKNDGLITYKSLLYGANANIESGVEVRVEFEVETTLYLGFNLSCKSASSSILSIKDLQVYSVDNVRSIIKQTAEEILMQVADTSLTIEDGKIVLDADNTDIRGHLNLIDQGDKGSGGFTLMGDKGASGPITEIVPKSVGTADDYKSTISSVETASYTNQKVPMSTSGMNSSGKYEYTGSFVASKTFNLPTATTLTVSNHKLSFTTPRNETVSSITYKLYKGTSTTATSSVTISNASSQATVGTFNLVANTDYKLEVTVNFKSTQDSLVQTTGLNGMVTNGWSLLMTRLAFDYDIPVNQGNPKFTIGYDGMGINFGNNCYIHFSANGAVFNYGNYSITINSNGVTIKD